MTRTDPVAFRLLAEQYKSDVILKLKSSPSLEVSEKLNECLQPDFLCYKQYVEIARQQPDYNYVTVPNVILTKRVKFFQQSLSKDQKVTLLLSPNRMDIVTGKH